MKITIEVHPKAGKYLKDLVSTGLFGLNQREAAERLFCRGLQDVRWLIAEQREKQKAKK